MPSIGAWRRLVPLVLGAVTPGLASCAADAPVRADAHPASPAGVAQPRVGPVRSADEQVRHAYLDSWHAYVRSLRTLDPAGLECCHADATLANLYEEVDERVRARRKEHVVATHDIRRIAFLAPDRAVVTDYVVEETSTFDADTGHAVGEPARTEQLLQFTLERLEGTWKVVLTAGY